METETSFDIVFEDKYLAVLDKPHGLQCEPDKNGHPDLCTEFRRYLNKQNRPPKILQPVNRLDRPVGGLVLFAKTATALRELNLMQEARQIQKTYEALLQGVIGPPEGTLSHFITKFALEKRAVVNETETPGSKPALLLYTTLETAGGNSRVRINLKTGRYHQIRAQTAFVGHPILGDVYYGGPPVDGPSKICLHAVRLAFDHPVTKIPLIVESSPGF